MLRVATSRQAYRRRQFDRAVNRNARNGRFTGRTRVFRCAAHCAACMEVQRRFPAARPGLAREIGTRSPLILSTRPATQDKNREHAIWRLRLATGSGISSPAGDVAEWLKAAV